MRQGRDSESSRSGRNDQHCSRKCLCWRALGGPRPRVTVTPTRASRALRRGLGRHPELVLLGRSPKGHLRRYSASSDSRTQLRTICSEPDPHPIRLDTVRLRGKGACAAPKIRSALVLTSFSFSRFPHFHNSCGAIYLRLQMQWLQRVY